MKYENISVPYVNDKVIRDENESGKLQLHIKVAPIICSQLLLGTFSILQITTVVVKIHNSLFILN